MPSLNKLINRPVHRERIQPQHRGGLGYLEKHKDYVVRAQIRHEKDRILKTLREKAKYRNPDEFYFEMNTVNKTKCLNENVDDDMQQLMDSTSRSYILSKITIEKKKIEKLMSSNKWLVPQKTSIGRHVVFDDNGKGHHQEDTANLDHLSPPLDEDTKQHISGELAQRKQRLEKILIVEKEMTNRRLLSEKGTYEETSQDKDGVKIYRWKKERKR